MKKDIHANYVDTKVNCLTCGASYDIKSIKDVNVDICANCHPFYTGKQRVAAADGRIEKFKRKYAVKK